MQPTNEDIQHWQQVAKRRNAILPGSFQFLPKKDVQVVCGNCGSSFIRPLIVGHNDPIYVCPKCQNRNYVPIDWNVTRR